MIFLHLCRVLICDSRLLTLEMQIQYPLPPVSQISFPESHLPEFPFTRNPFLANHICPKCHLSEIPFGRIPACPIYHFIVTKEKNITIYLVYGIWTNKNSDKSIRANGIRATIRYTKHANQQFCIIYRYHQLKISQTFNHNCISDIIADQTIHIAFF